MNKQIKTTVVSYLDSAGHRLAIHHNQLAENLQDGAAAPMPHVLFCGGFHSSMQGSKAQALAEFCTSNNCPYTRFDYRGHGDSEGDPHTFTLHDWLADTLQVLDLSDHPVVIVGSSMGAWLATLAALQRPSQIKGLLLLAAAPDFLQELVAPKLTPAQIWDLEQDLVVELPNDYDKPFPMTQALLNSGKDLSLFSADDLKNLTCSLRMLHGTGDTNVPYELSVRLMDGVAHSDAQLTLLHQADHRLSDERCIGLIKKELANLLTPLTN